MVSTISPVVYRSSNLGYNKWLMAAAVYLVGSVVGGVFVGALLGLLGALLIQPLQAYQDLFSFALGLFAIAYALHEMRLLSLPHPQRQRQVPDHWRYKFHPFVTAGLFGLLLGAGFFTFIPTGTYYVLGLATTLYGSPVTGVFIFAIFGAARALVLWPVSRRNTAPGKIERFTYYMDLTKPIMRQINGFALAMAGAYLIST